MYLDHGVAAVPRGTRIYGLRCSDDIDPDTFVNVTRQADGGAGTLDEIPDDAAAHVFAGTDPVKF